MSRNGLSSGGIAVQMCVPGFSPRGARFVGIRFRVLAILILLLGAMRSEGLWHSERAVDDLLQKGKAALEDQQYKLAQAQLAKYLKRVAQDSVATGEGTVLLAQALHGQQKREEVIRLLSGVPPAVQQSEWGGAIEFWLALARYETGAVVEALAALREFEARYPENAYVRQAKRLRIRCLLQTKRTDQALAAFAAFDKEHGATFDGVQNLLDWAEALVANGDAAQAREVFRKLIRTAPESEAALEGQYWLGQILVREGALGEARSVLSALLERPGLNPNGHARALFALGRVADTEGKPDEAVRLLREGLKRAVGPELRNEGNVVLGRLLIRQGLLNEGARLLKEFIAAVPSDPLAERMQLELAEYLLNHGHDERAVTEFQLYLETYSRKAGQARALYGKGWALLNLKRNAEASATFQKAYSVFPASSEQREKALLKVGDAFFADGRFKRASATYARFTAEFPDSALFAQAAYQQAESCARLGESAEAEQHFLRLAEGRPDDALAERALLRVAELADQRGMFQEALTRYDKAFAAFPAGVFAPKVLCSRGIVLYRLGRFDDAFSDFERIVTKHVESEFVEEAESWMGYCRLMLGEEQEALRIWAAFVQKRPESVRAADALFSMGEYEYNHGAYDKAQAHWMALFERHPKHELADDALLWAGRSAFAQKEYRRAVERLATLAKHYPSSQKLAEGRFLQGDAMTWLAEYSGAILAFDEVIKQYPNSYFANFAWGRKGDCQFALGTNDRRRYEEAIQSYRVVLDSEPAPLDLKLQARCKIGRCLEKMGKTAEALDYYLKHVVYKYLEHRKKGDRVDGAYWFTRAALHAAGICEAQNKWRRAVKIYRRIVDAGVPESAAAQERINKIRLDNWLFFY